ncbi:MULTISPECIES: hypothetical protein [Trichocoleus]|uniref:Uncharacterized protein n=1 Tax=Trichocoleus desertorum GB2-A4 TaxID=2933944 RepID=A0ABV0J2F2_9CYAN|nr:MULTISPECIES: hypothetical protein [unclassified Trichocoleus]MBD1860570.1 hypothetical protein [Trichocoleus sp. FACHB-46]MBD2097631.1 hypothetical protein [Trichocoleus sp. FACHB-591]MBD2119696.1 hypothetical protein [Trichocoleus sp. FACHB-262]
MLPFVVDERKILIFKFWFGDSVQDGLSYQGELFCRLQTLELQYRPQLYHFGCKLAQQGTSVVISSSLNTCSLWISLRDPALKTMLADSGTLDLPKVPPFSLVEASDPPQAEETSY